MTIATSAPIAPHKIERVLSRIDDLPRPVGLLGALLAADSGASLDSAALVRLIENDPRLGGLLAARLAAEVRRRGDVSAPGRLGVADHVTQLGFPEARDLCLCAGLVEYFASMTPVVEDNPFDRDAFWTYCLGVGCAARRIATTIALNGPGSASQISANAVNTADNADTATADVADTALADVVDVADVAWAVAEGDADDALVGGFIHAIGLIGLHARMPKSVGRVLGEALSSGCDLLDAERRLLGVEHTEAGRRLATNWGLPRRHVDCVWLHRQPPGSPPTGPTADRHVEIVQLAIEMWRSLRIGSAEVIGGGSADAASELADSLGLSRDDLSRIAAQLPDDVRDRAAWIRSDADDEPSWARALAHENIGAAEHVATAGVAGPAEYARYPTRVCGEVDPALHVHELCERSLASLAKMAGGMTTPTSIGQACELVAECVCGGLSVSGAVVVVSDDENGRLDVGICEGRTRSEAVTQPEVVAAVTDALRLASRWMPDTAAIVPAGRGLDDFIDRYRRPLRADAVWMLPLSIRSRSVAAALFPAPADQVDALRRSAAVVSSLGAVAAVVLSLVRGRAEAIDQGDALARTARDVRERDEKRTQARLLEAITATAAGAAHEMNNPLAVISGRAQLLRSELLDERQRIALQTIVDQAAKCSDIVTDLMSFARSRAPDIVRVDLVTMLDSLRQAWTKAGWVDAAALEIDVPSDTPDVGFDRAQLADVFEELVRNAASATDAATRRVTVKASGDLTEEWVVVEVCDNGRGMDSEVLARAMNPFFSHRTAGRGRGLGLARVRRWVEQNGGEIRLRSEPNRGTRVTLRLRVWGDGPTGEHSLGERPSRIA